MCTWSSSGIRSARTLAWVLWLSSRMNTLTPMLVRMITATIVASERAYSAPHSTTAKLASRKPDSTTT